LPQTTKNNLLHFQNQRYIGIFYVPKRKRERGERGRERGGERERERERKRMIKRKRKRERERKKVRAGDYISKPPGPE
jgi:hypothetical protein